MKTRDLIDILTQYDPTGEKEVLISNNDIDYVIKQPMYDDGKGYLITKRKNSNQPSEISLRTTGEKINLTPINTYEYYRKKILEDQVFVDIKTENNAFYWETSKLTFNKLTSLCYCKNYLSSSNNELYPYKHLLINKINDQINLLISDYHSKYISYCNGINCDDNAKSVINSLIAKINDANNNIILSTPLVYDNSVKIKITGFKNFEFEIMRNIINFTFHDIYSNDVWPIKNTNINLKTFDFKKNVSIPWQVLFNNKIENIVS